MDRSRSEANWLLRGLIAVSIGVHALIVMHLTGIYTSDTLTYIELTLKDFSKPVQRSIPRPRPRPKPEKQAAALQPLAVQRQMVPPLKPQRFEAPAPVVADTIAEPLGVPQIPVVAPAAPVDHWQPVVPAAASAAGSLAAGDDDRAGAYFDMVRLRVEAHKTYPARAKRRQIEGRVKVSFTIGPDGSVAKVAVVEGARYRSLDRAAVQAVKDAAPFPVPPRSLFGGQAVALKITIVFELI